MGMNETAAKRKNETDMEKIVIPVTEEQIVLDKRVIESGKVRVSKRVTAEEELVNMSLRSEEAVIERVPVNRFVDSLPEVRSEEGVTIIPVVREEMVVRLLLVEELRVSKRVHNKNYRQNVTLRREEVDIKRIAVNEDIGS